MQNHTNDISYFGRTNFRAENRIFGIRQADRLMHMYILGKTGTGKSTLLKVLALQDMQYHRGLTVLDPHGELVEELKKQIPRHRKRDLIYLQPSDPKYCYTLNPLENIPFDKHALVASSVVDVFRKLWSSSWGDRIAHILRFSVLALLQQKQSTLEDVSRLLLDEDYRDGCINNISGTQLLQFWTKEFPTYTKRDLMPVLNKLGAVLIHPAVQRIISGGGETISLGELMNSKKILLVNLSKGELGEDVSQLIGSLIVSSLASAAFSRISSSVPPHILYLDEFQNFTSSSLGGMLSELRKFHVGMVMSHQYIDQLKDGVYKSILGNVGTTISFRLGLDDARIMAKYIYPDFELTDFINLPNYSIFLKMMIDGGLSKPFSADTIHKMPIKMS